MPLFFHSSAHPSTNAAHPAFERVLKGERATRDATLALLERYGGPAGMKRAGIEDVKDWARSNGLRAGRIIDDMFKAIGEQTVTVPGTGMAETIIPPSPATSRPSRTGVARSARRSRPCWRTTLFSRS